MPDQYYENIRAQIKAAAGSGASKSDVLWAVADGVATVIDGATGTGFAGAANSAVQGVYSAASSQNSGVIPNPWMVWNGHDDAESPTTKAYLKHRGRMQLGGAAVSAAGALAAAGTVADVGALLSHGNATGSTVAHLLKFKAIAKGYKQSETISGWIDVLMKMKALKGAVRGGQFAAAVAAPIPWGGATAVSITAGVLAAGAKLGIKLKFSNLCAMTAMDLHWRCYQETALLGGIRGMSAGTGPANRILQELFIRRGMTRVFGQHNLPGLVKEPGGWLAINDKLLLI
ncbi:hypothetical protein [Gemmatimonas phototrophica]|uniref:Uncharacterized protein n=1 Tax=Gemmatimonas phototrophica TaxID=1379270 RepID=A0A143BKF6_9BACT|nr:hypothetical protein [Gemmatimonas phototrophica]AMW05546.1 hypothetical protein GEMMAAP_13465 [Gemmatimonas phototrophica]